MKVSATFLVLTLALATTSADASGKIIRNLRGGKDKYDLSALKDVERSSIDSLESVGSAFELSPSNSVRKSSSPSRPRLSEIIKNHRESFRKSLKESINSLVTRSRSNSRDKDEVTPRAADSGSIPEYISTFINFKDASPVDWNNLPLPREQAGQYILSSISEQLQRFDREFTDKTLKTLEYVKREFGSCPFFIHLAAELVNEYDDRAPNAMKTFLHAKMPFLRSYTWPNREFLGSLAKMNLDPSLDEAVSDLFLDSVHNSNNQLFHSIMIMYMQIFDGVTSIEDFNQRYIKFINALVRVTKRLDEDSKADIRAVRDTFKFNFSDLSTEIDRDFSLD